jgi:hypothetical protein
LNLVRHGFDRITGKQRCRALVGEALDHKLCSVPETGTLVKIDGGAPFMNTRKTRRTGSGAASRPSRGMDS